MKFELCTDSVEGATLAGQYGFTSIELCSALSAGGLTPSFGLIKQCVDQSKVEVHTMIRHNEGGFQITEEDLILMRLDIEAAKTAGAYGVVFGILDDNNEVSNKNLDLVQLSRSLGLKTTFHRAFDFVPDFRSAIEKVVSFGFDRLLTSGLHPKAENGIQVISEIQQTFGRKIQVIAGSGISHENALRFSLSGIDYLHFTARKPERELTEMGMGRLMVTDVKKIEQIVNLPFDHIN
ncbi:copper homeostasis protein CutC [Lutimonas vermicola]|uniref:Copper homeostasis protein cutC homolog n=1 Tax=Lutimonas vermicola TaxID=414288 RepID=A0ABU9KW87_9FLAO